MEKKTIELEIKSNLGDAEKSIGSLKSQLRQAQAEVATLSDKFGATSKEAIQAAKSAAILKDKIGDAKSLTDAFNPDAKFKALTGTLTGVAGGFSVITGALGAVGSESKDVEQAILKVQSAMAIASGAQAIGESVDQFRQLGAVVKSYSIVQKAIAAGQLLWNAAMMANPIGLLVAGVAALIAGGVALFNYFKSNSIAAEKNAASIKANKVALESQSKAADKASQSLQTNSDYQLAMAKASGASTSAIRKLELKLIDEKIAFANSSREIAKNTYHKNLNALASLKASEADEDQIASQEALTRKSLEEFGKQTKNLNDANAEKSTIIRRQNVEVRQEQTNHNTKVKESNKTASDKTKEDADKTKEDAKKALEDAEKERQALIGRQGEKAREEYEAAEKLIKDTRKANEDALKTENQIKVEKENADFELKKQSLIEKGLSIEEIEKEHKRKLAELDLQYYSLESDAAIKSTADAKANADAQEAIAKKLADAKIQNLQRGSAMLGQISDLVGRNTAAGKVAAVASATIDTYSAAQSAFKNAQLNPISIIGPAYPYISAGLAIAGGLKNVQSILAVKTPGGGGGSAPSGGGMGTAPAAPAFNVVGASATNQLAQTIGTQQQQPIRTYVVANDVTTQQGLDRSIVSSATIG